MKKFFIKPISFVLVLFVLFGVFIFPTAAEETETSGIIDGQVYSIVNVNSGKALDVSAGNTADNSDISQYTPTPSTYWQEWRIRYVGNGEYTIEDMHSRKFVTNSSNNAAIYTENNASSQRFRIVRNSDGTYTFLSKSSNYNKALGAYNAGTSNGETVVFIDIDGSNNQKYYLNLSEEYGIINQRVYSFVNLGNNEAIDVNAGNTATGSWIGRYTYYHDTPWQRWQVIYAGNGDYEIKDMHSGLLLSIPGSSASQTGAWIYPKDNTDGQKFRFQRNTDGTVTIFSKSSDYKMALGWNGGSLSQMPADNSANQKFNLILPGYVYNLQNVQSGRSVDVTAWGVTDGTLVSQFTRTKDGLNQSWLFNYVGNGQYEIMDMHSGKLLSVYGNSSGENASVCIWYDNDSSGQRFSVLQNSDGTISLLSASSNYQKALSSPGQANGDLVVQQTYNSNDNNQKFYINIESTARVSEGEYAVRCYETLKYMQKDNNGGDFAEQHLLDGDKDQIWRFEYSDSGGYYIINVAANKYLTSCNHNTNKKKLTLENLFTDGNIDRQIWYFSVHEYGVFKIQSRYHIKNDGANIYVSVGNGTNEFDSTGNGINVEQRNDGIRNKWTLSKVTKYGMQKYQYSTSTNQNCHGYAMLVDQIPNLMSLSDISYIYNNTTSENQAMDLTVNRFDTWLSNNDYKYSKVSDITNVSVNSNQYVVVLRVGRKSVMVLDDNDNITFEILYDYHFWYQLWDGTWANKHGQTPSEWLGYDVTPDTIHSSGWSLKTELENIKDFYSSYMQYYIVTIK